MKKILIGGSVLMMLAITTSCTKKGTCACQIFGVEVVDKYETKDKDEYNDWKENCENAGCTWSAGH